LNSSKAIKPIDIISDRIAKETAMILNIFGGAPKDGDLF
jgi:hypothetical protein